MKKIISKGLLKNIGYVLGYWAVFVIAPFTTAWYMNNYIIDHPSSAQILGYSPFYISLYVLFVAPFLYFIPYHLAKPKSKSLFIYLGFEINFRIL
jgi:hypothetical protein